MAYKLYGFMLYIYLGGIMTLLSKIGQVLNTEISTEILFKKKELQENTYYFLDEMKKRRSYYELNDRVSINPEYLIQLIKQAARCCPSALNSQSARVVILTQNSHRSFWQMVKELQYQSIAEVIWDSMDQRIDRCRDAYGIVLFLKIKRLFKTYKNVSPYKQMNFVNGLSKHLVWCNMRYGQQLPVLGLVHRFTILTRPLIKQRQRYLVCQKIGN